MTEPGYCQCGCGIKTDMSTTTNKKRGIKRGEPNRFIRGHSSRGENHPQWNGGRIKNRKYFFIKTATQEKKYEHRIIAEKALGKSLPKRAVVHHYNGYGPEGINKLVICQDRSYHSFIEKRTRALAECGHADWMKCKFCHKYDATKNLYVDPSNSGACHRECRRKYRNDRKMQDGTR
jgi:hypothetical protein